MGDCDYLLIGLAVTLIVIIFNIAGFLSLPVLIQEYYKRSQKQK